MRNKSKKPAPAEPQWSEVEPSAPNAEFSDAAKEQKSDLNVASAAEEKLKSELAEAQSKLVYMQADFQNFRKRAAKDISDARAIGAADALEPFLTVYDYLKLARASADKSDNIAQLKQGLEMIIAQYIKAIEESGVEAIPTVGKKFDPALHEAVSTEASDEVPEGEILREWAGGYRMGSRLLRPARVVVSSGNKPQPDTANDAQADGDDTTADKEA